MKRALLFGSFILLFSHAFAEHISGGEMSYIYLGPGATPGTLHYQVTLKMYRDCASNGALLDDSVTFTVFNTLTSAQFLNIQGIQGSGVKRIQKTPTEPCIDDPIELLVCFDYRVYTTTIDLPITSEGFTVVYQRCCRVNGMFNINSLAIGSTYFAKIPGNFHPGAETNTSPLFRTSDTVLICSARPFNFDFGATDADGDSLVYSFYNAFTGGGNNNGSCYTCIIPDPDAPPPYQSVTYINGFSFSNPLGPLVNINTRTGLISGTAPNVGALGNEIFAITVLVLEYRNGIVIGEHFKDLQIRIVDCQLPTALLDPIYTTCDGFTVSFQNNAFNNPTPTYFWDFGDPLSGANNTSIAVTPTHSFSDTGIYVVKLVLNRGLLCADSTTQVVRVYPGFLPGFITSPLLCMNAPIQFTDTTYNRYGIVDSWRWDFGDPSTLADTSHLQNPLYRYNAPGTFNVQLIVTSNKGCRKIYNKDVLVNGLPPLSLLPGDITYCGFDSLHLFATGTGTFSWTPTTNITGANTATPVVFPSVPTRYTVTLTDGNGCQSKDSLTVTPVFDIIALNAGADTTTCRGDGFFLNVASDAIRYKWTPSTYLDNDTLKRPFAKPLTTITYHVVAGEGRCSNQDDITIRVVPYPIANAGPDTLLCIGFSTPLHATGGTSYAWSPAAFLSNPFIPDPVCIHPTGSIQYIVNVRDTLGCPKPGKDTVWVRIYQGTKADAGPRDTSIVEGESLFLHARGGNSYSWDPPTWLNDPFSATPVSTPKTNIEYVLTATSIAGCNSTDTIDVKIYRLDEDIYVPTAFTPNKDGDNDVLRPILLGMKELSYFRVYNRWGVLMFSTTEEGKGWDGTYGGKAQDPATFVWMAEGTTYKGIKRRKKGYAVLIR